MRVLLIVFLKIFSLTAYPQICQKVYSNKIDFRRDSSKNALFQNLAKYNILPSVNKITSDIEFRLHVQTTNIGRGEIYIISGSQTKFIRTKISYMGATGPTPPGKEWIKVWSSDNRGDFIFIKQESQDISNSFCSLFQKFLKLKLFTITPEILSSGTVDEEDIGFDNYATYTFEIKLLKKYRSFTSFSKVVERDRPSSGFKRQLFELFINPELSQ